MDSSPFRIQIRRREKPSRPYTWEIRGASETKCVERGSYEYPTRGAAMKAARRALLRILVQYSNESNALFVDLGPMLPQIRAGKARVLGITSDKPFPTAPNIKPRQAE
jgi:hypothetical protein